MSLKFRSREFTRNRKIEENMKKKNLNFVDRHALWPPFQIQQQFVRDPLSEKKNTVRCSSCSVFLQVEKDEGKEAGFIFSLSWFAIAKSFFSISIKMASLCNSKWSIIITRKKQVAFDLFFVFFFLPRHRYESKSGQFVVSRLCVCACVVSLPAQKNCLDEIVRRVVARWWE